VRITRLPTGIAVAVQQERSQLQIRSCVLQPCQMMNDLRSKVERSVPHKVLDGDLDAFMAASLAARAGKGNDKNAA